MKYWVFQPNERGFEPMGNVKHVNIPGMKFPDDGRAVTGVKRMEQDLGVPLTVFRYTNFYDNRTFHRVYGKGQLIGT